MILVWLSFRYENKALFAIRVCGIMYTTVEDCNALIHFLFLSIYNLLSTLQVYNLFLKDSISRIFALCSKTFTTYKTILYMAIYTSSVREKASVQCSVQCSRLSHDNNYRTTTGKRDELLPVWKSHRTYKNSMPFSWCPCCRKHQETEQDLSLSILQCSFLGAWGVGKLWTLITCKSCANKCPDTFLSTTLGASALAS